MPDFQPEVVLQLQDVRKDYGGLRPLRIQELEIRAREQVSLLGLDAPAAEVFVNLATGAAVPDQGEVRAFGRSTTAIADSAEWLAVLDRFGLVSDRIVLLDALTVAQNLAVPLTLDIDPLAESARRQVLQLAREVGLEDVLDGQVADLSLPQRARLRLGRAVALDPSLLLLEHPTASVPAAAMRDYARAVAAVADRRHCAVLALTADELFARALSRRRLVLHLATGVVQRVAWWSFRR